MAWETIAELPAPRYKAAGVYANDSLILLGGNNGSNMSSIVIYDPSLDSWSASADSLPAAFATFSACIVGDTLVIGGGLTSATWYTADISDLSTWASKTSRPNTLGTTIVTNGTDVYYITNESTDLVCYSWDFVANTVTEIHREANSATVAAAIQMVGDVIYFIGGYVNSVLTNTVRSLDVSTGTYNASVDTNAPTNWNNQFSCVYNGAIYVAGGSEGFLPTKKVGRFIPGVGWDSEFSNDLPTDLRDAAMVAGPDGIYVVAGDDPSVTGIGDTVIGYYLAIEDEGGDPDPEEPGDNVDKRPGFIPIF